MTPKIKFVRDHCYSLYTVANSKYAEEVGSLCSCGKSTLN